MEGESRKSVESRVSDSRESNHVGANSSFDQNFPPHSFAECYVFLLSKPSTAIHALQVGYMLLSIADNDRFPRLQIREIRRF